MRVSLATATVHLNQNVDPASRPGNVLVAPACVAWLLLLALIAFAAADSLAAPAGEDATLTTSEAPRIRVGPWIDVLLDETGTLTLGDVHTSQDRFEPRSTRAGFGFHAGTLWVRLRLYNPAPHIWSRWLVSDIDRQEKDVVHIVHEDGTITAATQITETPARRPGGRTVFPVELQAGESATIYIAYSGQATTVLNLNFWVPIAYLRHVESITAARYFLMGLAVMMAFSCVIAALLRRAPGLLSGAAAVALALAYMATRDGFGNYVGKSWFGLDQQQILQITAILFVGSLAAFVRSFLALDGKSPWLRRLLRGLSIIAAPLALVPLWRSTPQLAVYFSGVALAAITLSVVANAVRGGGGSARAYLLGWCLLLVGILLRILQGIGWLRIEPDLLALIPPAAFGMASVAISIALYRSILEVQQRINNANRELRQREASERERLETAVVDRTRELHTALALVEKASADKSGFLSMMAHEIRSPLHSVIGHLQLLQRKQHSGQEENIRAIERATTRLLKMVHQTLSFSKGEQAAIRLDPGPVVLAPFLGDIAAAVGAAASDATQRTRVILGRELPAVIEVDEQYLRQVLENLATNACKYAPEGDVQIRVEALRSDPDAAAGLLRRLRFSVSDRGPGIAEADQMLIFEPFSRISTLDRMHGVGLGLPICRQLLQAMGSELNLDSDRGRGACFWFDLEVPALAEDSGSTEHAEDVDARASRPSDAFLAPALEMLELGQVLGIERWARATAETDPAYAPFLEKVVAQCIAVDLEALARLFASPGRR